MKTASNRSKRLSARTVLIIVVPLMLVLLLLNTGLLQRQLPAVSIGARSYTVAQFHYYLYNAYYDFVNEHAEELDQLGLDAVDRRMLRSIIAHYAGGPVGLETLAATVGEEAVTLEDVYEPYLMQMGFLTRTPRGRCVTRLAYEHLGLPFHGQEQLKL